jgi:hypothetical protein
VGTIGPNATFEFGYVKGKFVVMNTMNTCGGVKVSAHSFLTSTVYNYVVSITPCGLTPGERAPPLLLPE